MSLGQTLGSIATDARVALRSARRNVTFTCAIVITMTLGLTLSTVGFSLANAVLMRPLAVAQPDRLVVLERRQRGTGETDGMPITELEYLQGASRTTSAIAGYDYTRLNATGAGAAEMVAARLVSGNLFALLGISPMGRALTLDDDRPGALPVAVVSCGFAQRRLPGGAVGRILTLDALPVTVVGVLPCGFTGLAVGEEPEDLWLPMSLHPQLGLHDHTTVSAFARLASGVSLPTAERELGALDRKYQREIAARTSRRDADPADSAASWGMSVTSGAYGIGDLRAKLNGPLRLLNAIALVVLIIACGNVANLLLVRFAARRQELALRQAMGASASRVVRQLLSEAAVYAVPAGAASAFLSWAVGSAAVHYLSPGDVAPMIDLTPRGPTIAFAAAATFTAAFASGIIPALAATRPAGLAVSGAGARMSSDRTTAGLARFLVTAQIGLCFVLLLLAGQLAHGIVQMARIDPGFSTRDVLEFSVYPSTLGYRGPAELQLYATMQQRLSAIPGVEAAALSRYPIPTDYRAACTPLSPGGAADVSPNPVSAGLFASIGVPVLRGRGFSDADGEGTARVVVLTRQAARVYFPSVDPIGRTLRIADADAPAGATELHVVGVVGDIRAYGPRPEDVGQPTCALFVPVAQAAPSDRGQAWFIVRSAGAHAPAFAAIQRAMASVDPNLSVMSPQYLSDDVSGLTQSENQLTLLAGLFSGLALVLACLGVYGVLSYAVSRRINEIGVRVALGAAPATVRMMVIRDALRPIGIGVAFGLVGAGLVLPVAARNLYGLQSPEPGVAALCIGVLVAAGLMAALTPAMRAARIDPATALRAN